MKNFVLLVNGGLIAGIVIAAVIVIIILGIVVWWFKTYNRLVEGRNRVKTQWAQIDVQLKRRFDLIPNLVETIKGYTKHESEILTQFADARKMYADASKDGSVQKMSEANAKLNMTIHAVSEQYPTIKADASYNNLMGELRTSEDKIAHQRQFYNDTVNTYNNLREKFPSSIVANAKGFKEAELFTVTETEVREAPKVSF